MHGRLGNGTTVQQVYEAARHSGVLTVNGWYGRKGKSWSSLPTAAVNGQLGNGPTVQQVYEAARDFGVLTSNGRDGRWSNGPHFH